MNATAPDLLLRNCRVLTMDSQRPTAESVAVKGDRIIWVGSNRESQGLVSRAKRIINGHDRTLLPGFHDAHIHLLAYAASLQAVDCGPTAVSSIQDIKSAIARRAVITSSGRWIRAVGYSEVDLRERRHPTRWDLDLAAPENPVRLNHRSGHACVLNSRALEVVGISDSTPEPPGATILRDLNSGAPNGVLLEMDGFLEGKIPSPTRVELHSMVGNASQKLTSLGITAIQDATPSNSISRWDTFGSLKSEGVLAQRVTFMIGSGHVSEFLRSGLSFGSGDPSLRLGAAKVMLTASGGRLHPHTAALREIVHEL
ncbi:MAG: amidohydrolase family protein, partial [Chloroflexi bacterium]|nr:amidohydrolase family protein [Chloroflexota bacterium]